MEDCNAMHFCWTISSLLYRQEIGARTDDSERELQRLAVKHNREANFSSVISQAQSTACSDIFEFKESQMETAM